MDNQHVFRWQELSKQCEGLTAQLRAAEEKFVAAEAKREEAYAKELRRQLEFVLNKTLCSALSF